jgi:hypothetical protein
VNDLEQEILKEHSKRNAVRVARWVGNDPKRFAVLMDLFFSAEERNVIRCAWVLAHCADLHPELILPWIPRLVKSAAEPNAPGAVQRNVVRVLQFVDIPRRHQGRAANLCFNFLQDPKIPIAVKAFSMTVLANIARHEPDLKQEIALVIEQMLPYGSAGIQARAKKVLKQLSK